MGIPNRSLTFLYDPFGVVVVSLMLFYKHSTLSGSKQKTGDQSAMRSLSGRKGQIINQQYAYFRVTKDK
jgi:hypothetical protein